MKSEPVESRHSCSPRIGMFVRVDRGPLKWANALTSLAESSGPSQMLFASWFRGATNPCLDWQLSGPLAPYAAIRFVETHWLSCATGDAPPFERLLHSAVLARL